MFERGRNLVLLKRNVLRHRQIVTQFQSSEVTSSDREASGVVLTTLRAGGIDLKTKVSL